MIHGLLGEGVAASTRFDPQAKALGEWLRSRVVDIPEELLMTRRHPERRQLRELVRRFAEREIVPHLADWERAGEVPRDAARARRPSVGLLGVGFPEEVGGSGGDLLDSLAVTEEIILAGGSSGLIAALFTHGIALPHIVAAGDPALIDRYVRPTLAGEMIGALAVTEPDGGSDVAALRTTARRDGDDYVVNGSKTYITSGVRADFVTTAVRTGGAGPRGHLAAGRRHGHARASRVTRPAGEDGLALLRHRRAVLCRRAGAGGQPGRRRGHRLRPDHAALRQRAALAGGPGVRHRAALPRPHPRLVPATARRSGARWPAGRWCGTGSPRWPAGSTSPARTCGASRCVSRAGEPLVTEVAMAKNTAVAACDYVVDQAVQLHGGFGYLRDAEVERHYRDARILGIGGGTTEIMNEIIAKTAGGLSMAASSTPRSTRARPAYAENRAAMLERLAELDAALDTGPRPAAARST